MLGVSSEIDLDASSTEAASNNADTWVRWMALTVLCCGESPGILLTAAACESEARPNSNPRREGRGLR